MTRVWHAAARRGARSRRDIALLIEPTVDGFGQTGQARERRQLGRLDVEQFAAQQLRLTVQHEAEEQHRAAALRISLVAI